MNASGQQPAPDVPAASAGHPQTQPPQPPDAPVPPGTAETPASTGEENATVDTQPASEQNATGTQPPVEQNAGMGTEPADTAEPPTEERKEPPRAADDAMTGNEGMRDAEGMTDNTASSADPEAPMIDPLENPKQSLPEMPPGMSGRDATFELALGNTRFSMAERDMDGARSHLDLAKKLATTDEQKRAVERVSIVLDHLAEFWRGLRQAAGALQSGQDLAVKDTYVVVVEASPDVLLIRTAGRNQPYRVDELPGALVLAVAESWFKKDAESKLLVGTFLCFDAKGHADMGRQLFSDAAQAGLNVKPFLDELNARGSGTEVNQTRTRGNGAETGERDPVNTPGRRGSPNR
jgi:hypothetical protein